MNLTQGHAHRRSCWGAARTALTVFLVAIAIVYLFGGFDHSALRPH